MLRIILRLLIGLKSEDIYIRGFDAGYKKAWDSMGQKFKETAEKSAEISRNMTVEELIKSNAIKKK